ncbi:MAG: hypothetical protein AVDCRST_MAG96-342 [uncultured Segetibacter sp.]|uniref:Uncharacterized protein n=1 Tax=uncultured Segetibacter sp. TaxID=481133 RepID=A0A6J4RKC9_9BACT|nr:MAG: hypothetical protein AVDCRST_MAG96-342 [uncultured Segetibacter sp.]
MGTMLGSKDLKVSAASRTNSWLSKSAGFTTGVVLAMVAREFI